jgi:hypothetical protein
MREPKATIAHIVQLEDLVARSHSPDIKDQTRRLISRKTSPASLAGVDFQKQSALKKPVSSANEPALLCADLIEQSRSYAFAPSVSAEGRQSGRQSWR